MNCFNSLIRTNLISGNPCANKNGKCQHNCNFDGKKVFCTCFKGYKLKADKKTCCKLYFHNHIFSVLDKIFAVFLCFYNLMFLYIVGILFHHKMNYEKLFHFYLTKDVLLQIQGAFSK